MTMQIESKESHILQGQNMDEKLEQAKRIVSRDEDKYYINKLEWISSNFKREDPIFLMYVEETVENCLDLAVRHAFEHYVRTQEMIKQHQLIETPQNVRKLNQPTTRWSGLPDRVTYKYSCTACHALMVGPNDGCKCPGLPYAEHDNGMIPECKKTCVERFADGIELTENQLAELETEDETENEYDVRDPPGTENNLAKKDLLLEGPDYGTKKIKEVNKCQKE